MYYEVINRIDHWVATENIPRKFLIDVAEKAKSQTIDWLKFEAKSFHYEYVEDENYISDVVVDKVNDEAWRYLENLEYEKEKTQHAC